MDKNAIKKYAVWARRELIEKVSQKALQYDIEDGKELDPKLDSINGVLLSDDEKKQRQALIRKINENGYTHVMEEVAYTWFNRFIALRFMEVNGYLPSHVRVFTDEAGDFKPQIMSEALHLDLEGIDMEKVYELKNDNRDDDLFKYLLITQCNALSGIFPKMFQKISDYTELLLPDYLLREGSVIEQMVNQKDGIPEADWQDQVQIIGWLYQYYNSEPKDEVFAALNNNVKITKETIPAATQLFTPDWIVHYMVENSLGRLWLEGHPNDSLKSEWKYYLDEAKQEPDVQKQLEEIRKEYAGLKPEEIKCIDPCMGSGHILCVLFDTLIKIYEDYGYSARDAAASIVENNLWGLDIDERAAQLAYFAVMMKARQYDRRFLTRGIQPHVYAIEESNGLKYDGDYGDFLLDKQQQETLLYMFDIFKDAKEYGSILNVDNRDYDSFINAWELIAEQTFSDVRMLGWYMHAVDKIYTLANQAKALSQKYHVVVTNPPYMTNGNMSAKILDFVKDNYLIAKSDLCTVFVLKCTDMLEKYGFQGMITQQAWMFLSSYSEFRKDNLNNNIVNMAHLGARAFEEIAGEVVQTVSWIQRKCYLPDYKGRYSRLIEYNSQNEKEGAFLAHNDEYIESASHFEFIPNIPIVYWLSSQAVCAFDDKSIADVSNPKRTLQTGDSKRFMRNWYEVSAEKTSFSYCSREEALSSDKKWFMFSYGGQKRKWYGNLELVVNWENNGQEIKKTGKAIIPSETKYFVETIAWSKVTTGDISLRYYPSGILPGDASACLFDCQKDIYLLEGYLNSKVAMCYLAVLSPTLNYATGTVAQVPYKRDAIEGKRIEIEPLVKSNNMICKKEWDSFETSWDFEMHPFIKINRSNAINGGALAVANTAHYYEEGTEACCPLEACFLIWRGECNARFHQLKENEEELNRIFIDIYGLQDELSPKVEDKDVTVRLADIQRDIRSFISYAVGCMFGRYSLDVPGLVYAGGQWDASKYKTFKADLDAIIPICDDEYFPDDIVGKFIEFIEQVYGKDTLEDNLQFIADVLGGKGSAREIIRNYFSNDFYADHLKIYQKHPIYWLFDSGKKNGFKCLVYMHRYKTDTIARIRTDYVHEQQARYRTAIEEIEKRIDTVSSSEKVKLTKKLNSLRDQDEELHAYEEKIHHLADQMISIDLDDGVKHNYDLFKDVLAKIK